VEVVVVVLNLGLNVKGLKADPGSRALNFVVVALVVVVVDAVVVVAMSSTTSTSCCTVSSS